MAKTQTAAPPKPHPDLEHLAVFEGSWKIEGKQFETRIGPAAGIRGTEHYEWLKGGHFLVHHFDARLGDGDAVCIEIISYDDSARNFPVHTWYNNGVTAEWTLSEQDGDWILTGAWEMNGERLKIRCLIAFTNDGKTRTSLWQASGSGKIWETFWDLTATRT